MNEVAGMELKYYAGKDVLDALLDCMERISKQDGADVVKVVHGKWEERGVPVPYDVGGLNKIIMTCCSVCGQYGEKWMHYCPNCGAKMEDEG